MGGEYIQDWGRSVTSDEWAVFVYHCKGYGKIVCLV